MAMHVKKPTTKLPLRKEPKRGTSSGRNTAVTSRRAAGEKIPASKALAARQAAKAKDQAQRATIAKTFDAAAFEAANDQILAETAKDWSTQY